MAIEVTGTNYGYNPSLPDLSSVQVAVGPAGTTHKKDKFGVIAEPISGELSFLLIGCFDPANRKCYSGGGTSATDFVSGTNYTITGNANSDTTYKSENIGIIELTGGGYIKGNVGYTSGTIDGSSLGGNTIEMWFWPSTGPTQEEAIFEFKRNDIGSYENGYSITRRSTGNQRTVAIYGYRNNGTIDSTTNPSLLANALYLNTWNHIVINESRASSTQNFRRHGIRIKSKYHEYNRESIFHSFPDYGYADPDGYNPMVERELTIGRAFGITGTFKGKIGCVKIYKSLMFNKEYPVYDPEGETFEEYLARFDGTVQVWKAAYESLAPRYDQYD